MGIPAFFTYLPEKFCNFRQFATKTVAMFGSTNVCEQLFSFMKAIKTSKRTRQTDKYLSSLIKVGATHAFQPDIQKIVSRKRCQTSGQKMLKNVLHFVFVKAFHYFMFMNVTKHSNDVPNVSVTIFYDRCYSFYYILSTPLMVMCTCGPHGNMHMTHVALKQGWKMPGSAGSGAARKFSRVNLRRKF